MPLPAPQVLTDSTSAGSTTAADSVVVNTDPGVVISQIEAMVQGFLRMLPNLIIALVVFVLFVGTARLVRGGIRKASSGRRGSNVAQVLGRVSQILILFVGLLIAVGIIFPSVKGAQLLQLLGVGSVAIGFAFRDIAQNFLAGLLILLRQPFRVGDQIVYKDFEGTVENIETRATMLKTYDGVRAIIPNGEIYTNAVKVNTAFEKRRSEYVVGIGYGDDLREAMRIMRETAAGVEGVLPDPAPEALTVELAEASVNVKVRWWTKPGRLDVVTISSEVLTAIKLALDEAGIDMPYPTHQVLFHDQTEATDGDRTRQREGWPKGDAPPQPRTIAGVLAQQNGQNGAQNSPDKAQA